jgi:2-phosphosulfolactate phosphatase
MTIRLTMAYPSRLESQREATTVAMYFDQTPFDVRCEWGRHAIEQIAPSDVIIIVDVLSFTTCVDVAVGRGATVYPYRWKDEAVSSFAKQRGAEVAGPRGRVDGGFSLSPSSLERVPTRLKLVLPSPNGSSLAFQAMSTGATVAAGCLRNASAVAQWAQSVGRSITVVPAGEQWPDGSLRPGIEDLIGAGAIVTHLSAHRSPEALVAARAFEGVANCLQEHMLNSASGQELAERGFERDVELAAELNISSMAPVLHGEAFVALSRHERGE